MNCRMCSSLDLTEFLDLGFSPPADRFLRREQLAEPEVHYPLRAVSCGACGLVQLDHVVSPEILYRHDYPYEASITRTGARHWDEFARSVTARFGLGARDLVVDVGSNVGVLLAAFRSRGVRALGVDPASNIVRIAERRGIETLCEFFSPEVARQIVAEKGHASVVTATNVFAHIDDLDAAMRAVDALIGPDGVFVIEAPCLVDLVERLEYDTIYHEHVSYFSLKPLAAFVRRFGMAVFDVERRDIHGGSFRLFVSREGKQPVSPAVASQLLREEAAGLLAPQARARFAAAVDRNARELSWMLHALRREGKRIAAVSAPAKGMTLLNHARIGRETIEFVTEKSHLKIGRFTPGGHIPVLPDDALLDRMPDYALLLAWNFADEIMDNLSGYRARGGKFIIPIPTPRIV